MRYLRYSVLVLTLILAAMQFYTLRAPQPLHLPVQQQVATSNSKVGIHTRLAGFASEELTERTYTQVREMGASWVVELFPWAYVQPRSRYGYDWAGADLIINHARRQGLTVVARLDVVPQWARPASTTDRFLDPDRYGDYAAYVAAFLARYRPLGVRHVVIWNEPNLAGEWGQRRPDPAAYAALLKTVYPQAKAAAPDAVVIAGALSPGLDLGGGDVRLNDLTYTERFYTAGGGPYFDMWAIHSYGAQSPPDAPPAAELVNFRRAELARALLVAHGDAHKKLIITEGGWNDSARWSAAVLPSQRVRYTVAAYRMAQGWDWLEATCLWQFGTPWRTYTYQDSWNFTAYDGTPKAIYWAVQEAFVP
ncbi:MAG: hypothetical protein H7Z42_15810 [Roseiflexaceae bacterium]|nr:hypothetical protein [Roseiflexaceae bacterium]